MKEVTVQELKAMRDRGDDFQLIDVREEHEYEMANLNGELIPLGTVMENLDKISREKMVVVHCRSGARSGTAIMALESQHGYTNLHNLKGGIMAYAREIDNTLQVS